MGVGPRGTICAAEANKANADLANERSAKTEERELVMGSFSVWHWVIALALIVVLFGRGRVSAFMGDIGTGLRDFKRTLKAVEEKELSKD
jgi:sec-independent protein translocase protein TatA